MLYVGTDGELRGMAPVQVTASTLFSAGMGQCLMPQNGSSANGTRLVGVAYGSTAQQFRRYPDGTVRVLGKCLDVYGAGTANSTAVTLFDCHGNGNQVWAPSGQAITNPASGRCLLVQNGQLSVIFDCLPFADQYWSIPSVTLPMVSANPVTDGNWHHVVLSAGASGQTLYLDGSSIGTITGPVVDHRGADTAFIGNGKANSGLPGGPASTTNFGFTGQIDDVAFYRHPLADSQVAEHYAARTGSTKLTTVVEPGPFTATTVELQPCHRPRHHPDRPARRHLDRCPTAILGTNQRSRCPRPRRAGRSPTPTTPATTDAVQPAPRPAEPEPGPTTTTGFVATVTDENANTTS